MNKPTEIDQILSTWSYPTPKEEALRDLEERKANPPTKIDNSSLYAGSPMYFYCVLCEGAIVLPEDFTCEVPKLCKHCEFMKEMNWL